MKTTIYSMRDIRQLAGHCPWYEGEDLFSELMSSDMLTPNKRAFENAEFSRRVYRALSLSSHPSLELSSKFIKKNNRIKMQKCDFFLSMFHNPSELFALNLLDDWREKSNISVCYINEFWSMHLTHTFKYILEILKRFDHIFIGMEGCVDTVARITGRPCNFLPLGVDAIKFSPEFPSERNIHICNIGRRSDVTHGALVLAAEKHKLFYYHDTLSVSSNLKGKNKASLSVKYPRQHRLLLANILKNSRYFIVNPAMVDSPLRDGQEEIPSRFFEGAASGTVMLGRAPRSNGFKKYFDWPDSVIEMPFDSPDIFELIEKLECNIDRISLARRTNVLNSLSKHDWLYRLKEIYSAVDLEMTNRMIERESLLKKYANSLTLGKSTFKTLVKSLAGPSQI